MLSVINLKLYLSLYRLETLKMLKIVAILAIIAIVAGLYLFFYYYVILRDTRLIKCEFI